MKIRRCSFNNWKEAIEQSNHFQYGLIYMMSELLLFSCENMKSDLSFEEILEARFFGENGEIHLFKSDEGINSVEISDDENEEVRDVTYPLEGRFKKMGRLLVRQYIVYDGDGQGYVALTRCVALQKEKEGMA